ncbi:bel12-ag transposon polyprotein [Lasius niger]|uniref:Bel12-ag transposon polyprotein n=1 Tax=Lasius niger TaxID=67767 RepID=A0A0J7MPD0_LASNI|nr:bel12-ag transposon polyprotein [Lasius niger]
MKSHLLKTCKTKVLNFEELITLLTQIEACLNSRPLTPLSSDPKDLEVLTPGHFLVGPAPLTLQELNGSPVPTLLENWRAVQSLRDQFWTRWSKEYLVGLQQRSKWKKFKPNVQVGDLVLVSDDTQKSTWPLARVTKTFPGDDGVIRVVELKMQNGTFKRSIHKLCPLPSPPSGGGGC